MDEGQSEPARCGLRHKGPKALCNNTKLRIWHMHKVMAAMGRTVAVNVNVKVNNSLCRAVQCNALHADIQR